MKDPHIRDDLNMIGTEVITLRRENGELRNRIVALELMYTQLTKHLARVDRDLKDHEMRQALNQGGGHGN